MAGAGDESLTILDGGTFCVCDERGDIAADAGGFFAADTRFLSQYCLLLDGARPSVLTTRKVEYFSAAFFLRNGVTGRLPADSILVRRDRFVGADMHEHLVVSNLAATPIAFDLDLVLAADFADILTVKAHAHEHGAIDPPPPLPPARRPIALGPRRTVLVDPDGSLATEIVTSCDGVLAGGRLRFPLALAAHVDWELRIDIRPLLAPATDGVPRAPRRRQFGREPAKVDAALDSWHLDRPRLRTSWYDLDRSVDRSVADLASLRLQAPDAAAGGRLPAAGMPWFMTVFGRDTAITCLQTMLLGPDLATAALESLAGLQSVVDDPAIDAEPGKIVHELRRGRAAETWFARYYGTVDATPLFLVLLSEVWRWTADDDLVRRLWPNALAALGWIDSYGDRDGDGLVEFERRSARGLAVQSWKDSPDSQRFADGTVATGPIAVVEVQGYVYDAKLRVAELARAVFGDEEHAVRLEAEAARLRTVFDERFWIDRRGGYLAMALDGEKRPVDSLTSNIGHALWSGIVLPERVDAVVERLLTEPLWSGWGVRTMSTEDAGYSPLAYHRGTIWPHDNALIAWGLARAGRRDDAIAVAEALLEVAAHFDHALPEVFAGIARSATPFPVSYPMASRPQAWAAGTPLLLLRVLLGVEPDPANRRLVAAEAAPDRLGEITLEGIRAFGARWSVHASGGEVTVRRDG
jgi:glycogen debranching enzyme